MPRAHRHTAGAGQAENDQHTDSGAALTDRAR